MKTENLINELVKQITDIRNNMIKDLPTTPLQGSNVYLLTVTYKDIFSSMTEECKVTTINRCQGKFFGYLLNKTVSRYSKPKNRWLQPVSLDFVDFPGTRKSHANTLKPPHTHSIVIVPPETQKRFNSVCHEICDRVPKTEKTNLIKNIDCQFIAKLSDLPKVVDYASKFYQKPSPFFRSREINTQLYTARGGERTAKPV